MTIVNITTPNLGLPLPNPANRMIDDISRIISAFTILDTDIITYAPLISPHFSGLPTVPTLALGDNSASIASTAFVAAAAAAHLISPIFSGTPTVPTLPLGDVSKGIANTLFVTAAIAAIPSANLTSYATKNFVTSAIAAIPLSDLTNYATKNFVASAIAAIPIQTPVNLTGYAPLASPSFTGTVNGITSDMVGLGNVDNISDINKPVSTKQAIADAKILTSAEAYADSILTSLWNDRGTFDASVNTYPTTNGSGTSGAILKGDMWTISVSAILGPLIGDLVGGTVRALVSDPQQVDANWAVVNSGMGYVAADIANPLSQFASTTSLQLESIIPDATGNEFLVFSNNPTLTNPILNSPTLSKAVLGTPVSGDLSNCSGTALNLTVGSVKTIPNLTGDVTSVGNVTTLNKSLILGMKLTNFVSTSGTIDSTDSILSALEKVQGNTSGFAPLMSPSFEGNPLTVTPDGTIVDQIVNVDYINQNVVGFAPIDSPIFTGIPSTTTPDGSNPNQIANVAYITQQLLTIPSGSGSGGSTGGTGVDDDTALTRLASSLKTVAFSGSYADLLFKPFIPTKTSDFKTTNDFKFQTLQNLTDAIKAERATASQFETSLQSQITALSSQSLSAVAFTGDYGSLINVPQFVGLFTNDAGYQTAPQTTDLINAALGAIGVTALTTKMDNEIAARIAGDSTITANLNSEISRAKGVEGDMSAKILAVSTGIQTTFTGFQTQITQDISSLNSSNASSFAGFQSTINSFQTQLNNNNTALGTESTRALKVETDIAASVLAEQKRASGVEGTIAASVTTEQSRAMAAESSLLIGLNALGGSIGNPLDPLAFSGDWADIHHKPSATNRDVYSAIAFSGNYADLLGKPLLINDSLVSSLNTISVVPTVVITGQYEDLIGIPPNLTNLDTVDAAILIESTRAKFAESTLDLKIKTTLQAVGISLVGASGLYSDLSGLPSISNLIGFNKVAFTGQYSDLTGAFSGKYSDLTGAPIYITDPIATTLNALGVGGILNSAIAIALNKNPTLLDPTIITTLNSNLGSTIGGVSAVGLHGKYSDLTNQPSITNLSGFNKIAFTGNYSDINPDTMPTPLNPTIVSNLNANPTLLNSSIITTLNNNLLNGGVSPVGLSGQYSDLKGNPTAINPGTNFKKVAFTGSYSDLDQSTVPIAIHSDVITALNDNGAVFLNSSIVKLLNLNYVNGVNTIATVGLTGNYSDLTGIPDLSKIDNNIANFISSTQVATDIAVETTRAEAAEKILSDTILSLGGSPKAVSLAPVATLGTYASLSNKPSSTLPSGFNPVAFSGKYSDLTGMSTVDLSLFDNSKSNFITLDPVNVVSSGLQLEIDRATSEETSIYALIASTVADQGLSLIAYNATCTYLNIPDAPTKLSYFIQDMDYQNSTDVDKAILAETNLRKAAITTLSDDCIPNTKFGTPSGVATLDSHGTILISQLPSSVIGDVQYQGIWDANLNNPFLSSGLGNKGQYYKVSVAGHTNVDGITQWNVNDNIIFDGSTWDKIGGSAQSVTSVNARIGDVILTPADVGLGNIDNTSDKYKLETTLTAIAFTFAPLLSPIFLGTPAAPTPTALDNSTTIATTAFVQTVATNIATSSANAAIAGLAKIASPNFTGTPTAPTPTALDNSTNIATTAFVKSANAAIIAATNIAITDDTNSNVTNYLHFGSATTGSLTTVLTSSTELTYNPSTGTLSAINFSSLSDKTLKSNVQDITNSSETLKQIKPVEFTWNKSGKKSYGVIAQELEQILPELVSTNDEGIKSVEYSALIGFLIASNKELLERIEILETKVKG